MTAKTAMTTEPTSKVAKALGMRLEAPSESVVEPLADGEGGEVAIDAEPVALNEAVLFAPARDWKTEAAALVYSSETPKI